MKIKGSYTVELNKEELTAIHNLIGEMSYDDYEQRNIAQSDIGILDDLYNLIEDAGLTEPESEDV